MSPRKPPQAAGRVDGPREGLQGQATLSHAVQYPVTVLCYYGPGDPATGKDGSGIVSRDAAGQYWCDGKRFSSVNDAYDYAEAHQ